MRPSRRVEWVANVDRAPWCEPSRRTPTSCRTEIVDNHRSELTWTFFPSTEVITRHPAIARARISGSSSSSIARPRSTVGRNRLCSCAGLRRTPRRAVTTETGVGRLCADCSAASPALRLRGLTDNRGRGDDDMRKLQICFEGSGVGRRVGSPNEISECGPSCCSAHSHVRGVSVVLETSVLKKKGTTPPLRGGNDSDVGDSCLLLPNRQGADADSIAADVARSRTEALPKRPLTCTYAHKWLGLARATTVGQQCLIRPGSREARGPVCAVGVPVAGELPAGLANPPQRFPGMDRYQVRGITGQRAAR